MSTVETAQTTPTQEEPAEVLRRERLQKARKKNDDHAAAKRRELEDREIEVAELTEKLEVSTKGKRGTDFEVVSTPFGVYGIRKPDHQAVTNWDKATNEKRLSLDWQIGLLRHYILPDPNVDGIAWAQQGALRPGIVWETAAAFTALMGAEVDAAGKGR